MYQIVPMTKEEQEKMYMKLSKKQLVEMLINCNHILNNLGYDVSKSTVRVQVFPTVELKEHKSDTLLKPVITFSCTRDS